MNLLRLVLSLVAVCAMLGTAAAQTAVDLAPRYRDGTTYADLKAWHERTLSHSSSTLERDIESLRTLVRAKMGQRGLDSMFQNFEGRGAIDPRIPGVVKNVRLVVSDNPHVARGARRTQLYANAIHNDGRFRLLAIDEYHRTPLGPTDKDILFRHEKSRSVIRAEVKEWKASTQRRNFGKLQRQIDKMVLTRALTNEMQVLFFSKEVIAKVRDYASRKGIPLYESVVTGVKSRQAAGKIPFSQALNHLDREALVAFRVRSTQEVISARTQVLRGGAGLGFGLVAILDAGPDAWAESGKIRHGTDDASWYRFGNRASLAGAGLGGMVGGGAEIGSLFSTSEALTGRLVRTARIGGVAATAAFLVAEGFLIIDYRAGGMSTREFVGTQASLGGGLVGGGLGTLGGAKLGAVIGLWFSPAGVPVGAALGGVAGGIGGGWIGSTAMTASVGYWYDLRDFEQDRKFRQFLTSHFEIHQD